MAHPVDAPRFAHRPRRLDTGWTLLLVGIAALAGLALPAEASQVELVSRANPPYPYGTGHSFAPSVSADGRFVAFLSWAGNLAPGQVDSFSGSDAFLADRQTGITTLLTHRDGLPAVATESSCISVQVSADGRYVAFASGGTDLVPSQTGSSQYYNLFLYDRIAGTTTLVSHLPGSPAATSADGSSLNPRLSQDGRYVAYESYALDLVAGETDPTHNGPHVYLWDRDTDTTALVSHSAASPTTTGRFSASLAAISADGALVAFDSSSDDLLPGGTFPTIAPHAFLYERATGTVTLVDHANGAPTSPANGNGFMTAGSLSSDARFVLFGSFAGDLLPGGSPASGLPNLYLYDRLSGGVTLVTHPAGQPTVRSTGIARFGGLSADGRFVSFSSSGLDLVAGQTGPAGNVFLWDRTTGTSRLVSHLPGAPLAGTGGGDPAQVDSSGVYGTSWIDADGGAVVYRSLASNLVSGQVDPNPTIDLFVWDRASDTNRLVSHFGTSTVTATSAAASSTALSGDGGTIVFDGPQTVIDRGAADPYNNFDVFAYDRPSQALSLVSHATSSSLTPIEGWIYEYDPTVSLSADGRFVTFLSDGVDLVPGQVDHLTDPNFEERPDLDLFLADRAAGTTVLLSHAAGAPGQAVRATAGEVSADGRYVAFASDNTHIVSGQTGNPGNVFLYDRVTGQTVLVSHASGSATAGGSDFSFAPALSADGRYLVFLSYASDLVAGLADTNQAADVFLYDRVTGQTVLVSHASGATSTSANGWSGPGRLSPDGRYVAFGSSATNLVDGQVDANGANDLFLYDRLSGVVTLVSHADGTPATAADSNSYLPFQEHQRSVTADGHVVFLSRAGNLVAGQSGTPIGAAVFLYDAGTGTSVLVSHAAGAATVRAGNTSDGAVLSADGRTVAYRSSATDLVTGQSDANGDYDVFLYDATNGETTLVSHTAAAPQTAGDGLTYDLAMSDDGRTVAFSSTATDLVPDLVQRFAFTDVYVWNRDTGAVTLASHTASAAATTGTDYSRYTAISGDGSAVAFMSFAADLVPGDANGAADVYVSTAASASPPTGLFFTLTPCRLLDTRLGGGALHSGGPWTLPTPGACGIPSTAAALAANVIAIAPSGAGFLSLYPADRPAPLASSLNFSPGQTRTNNLILPLASGGRSFAILPFVTGNGTVDVVVDVVGYFE